MTGFFHVSLLFPPQAAANPDPHRERQHWPGVLGTPHHEEHRRLEREWASGPDCWGKVGGDAFGVLTLA